MGLVKLRTKTNKPLSLPILGLRVRYKHHYKVGNIPPSLYKYVFRPPKFLFGCPKFLVWSGSGFCALSGPIKLGNFL